MGSVADPADGCTVCHSCGGACERPHSSAYWCQSPTHSLSLTSARCWSPGIDACSNSVGSYSCYPKYYGTTPSCGTKPGKWLQWQFCWWKSGQECYGPGTVD